MVRDVQDRWHGPLAQQGRPIHATVARLEGTSQASSAAVSQILDVLLTTPITTEPERFG